jgi:hypothetical protein
MKSSLHYKHSWKKEYRRSWQTVYVAWNNSSCDGNWLCGRWWRCWMNTVAEMRMTSSLRHYVTESVVSVQRCCCREYRGQSNKRLWIQEDESQAFGRCWLSWCGLWGFSVQPREIHWSCQQGTVDFPFACAESYPQSVEPTVQALWPDSMNLRWCCWTALAVTVACWTESVLVMSWPFAYVVWYGGTVEPAYSFSFDSQCVFFPWGDECKPPRYAWVIYCPSDAKHSTKHSLNKMVPLHTGDLTVREFLCVTFPDWWVGLISLLPPFPDMTQLGPCIQ